MPKPDRCVVSSCYELCLIACPHNKWLDQLGPAEYPVGPLVPPDDDAALEIVFDVDADEKEGRSTL